MSCHSTQELEQELERDEVLEGKVGHYPRHIFRGGLVSQLHEPLVQLERQQRLGQLPQIPLW